MNTHVLAAAEQVAHGYAEAIMIALFVGVLGSLIISAMYGTAMAWLVLACYKRIPSQHHQIAPHRVWLLGIPVVNVFCQFVVFGALADAFKHYFESKGDASEGDCGFIISLLYCTSCLALPLTCYFRVASLVWLVLLVTMIVRFLVLKAHARRLAIT